MSDVTIRSRNYYDGGAVVRKSNFKIQIIMFLIDKFLVFDLMPYQFFFSFTAKWLACQSMDNQIVIFNAINRFKFMRKKTFKGHMVCT